MVGPPHRAFAVVLIGVAVSFSGVGQPLQPSGAVRPIPWALVCLLLLVIAYWFWPPYDLAAKLRVAGRLTTSADEAEMRRGVGLYMRIVEEHGPSLEACLNLAACYETGLGCEENLAVACKWYERAASPACPAAQTRLAHYLFGAASGSGATLLDHGGTRDVARAMSLWEEAAGQGDVEAMDQCGHRYIEGTEVAGVPQDLAKVVRWWGRAARAGHAASQYTLGLLYLTGVHAPTVAHDEARGARWLRAAATQGHPTAAWVLDVSDARRHALARQELRAAVARRGRSARRAHAAARAALLLLRHGAAWSSGGGGGDGDGDGDGDGGSDSGEGCEARGGGLRGEPVGPAALAEAALAEAAEAAWAAEPGALATRERGEEKKAAELTEEAREGEELVGEREAEAEEMLAEGAEGSEEDEQGEEETEDQDEGEEDEEAAVAREHERMVATLRERTAHAPAGTQCVICFDHVDEHARRALPCAPERRHWLCADCLRADVDFRRSVRQHCVILSRDGPGRGGRGENAVEAPVHAGATARDLQRELLCPFCRAAVPEAAAEALLLQ